ncbi:hypothetical protein OS145_02550 [Idiomarina baltica OS145]|uniref:Uncharacterized protein n=1 Tax=Idiomarina baltica OS145 TaxID=314276 RepID=A0ABP2CTL4_9GAMM|nr:hypothetical protein [Idiomarina baltica]EAQ33212.1 hypothetical protein OS145_02550 [Idiomarina baltica OS145]
MALSDHQDVTVSLQELFTGQLHGKKPIDRIDPLKYSQLLRRGIEGAAVSNICSELPAQLLATALDLDVPELFRLAEKERLSPQQTEIIGDFVTLWSELKSFFEDDLQLLTEWLETRLPVLNGEAPVTFINTFIGRNKIGFYPVSTDGLKRL